MEAPRWRLTNAHYINVPELPDGTRVEWEHKETSRENGRSIRKLYSVPMLLDPKDAADHNYPGDIIVTRFVEGARMASQDYIFVGDPTPEMEPINDEARAITDACRSRWDNPIDSLPANGGMSDEESVFMQKMMETFARIAPPQENQTVPKEAYDELKERLSRLEAAMSLKPEAPTPGRRA